MIDLNFGLWWSGSKLSYLRYLTFKTLRHFHPHSRIQLFVGNKFKKDGYNWSRESFGLEQEFQNPDRIKKDYLEDLKDIGVEISHVDFFAQYLPNFQSDLFRYWFLKNHGGFYLDTDVIILKSFKELPLDNKLIYCSYGGYYPVGVLGATKDSKIVNHIIQVLPKFIDVNNYNSAGPYMFRDILNSRSWGEGFNAPAKWFYPIPFSNQMPQLYTNDNYKIPDNSLCLHYFGGLPASQKFNRKYTEEFAKKSNDAISRFLREKKLI